MSQETEKKQPEVKPEKEQVNVVEQVSVLLANNPPKANAFDQLKDKLSGFGWGGYYRELGRQIVTASLILAAVGIGAAIGG